MKSNVRIIVYLFLLLPLGVCAATKITDRDEIVFKEIPKPAHIWVHDFAGTGADVPAESALAGQHSDHDTPQTPEQIAAGRKLGTEIASELVEQIRAMGLPAERPTAETKPQKATLGPSRREYFGKLCHAAERSLRIEGAQVRNGQSLAAYCAATLAVRLRGHCGQAL